MNKVLSVAKTILAWVFVVFCLLMAIGCGSVSGSILFILTAVLSVPLKIVRNLWDKVLGIKEIPDLPEDTPAKWYEAKKKKEQKAHKNAVEDQKKRRLFKPLIIAMAFIISFAVAMGNSETINTADSVKESTEVTSIEATEAVQETVAPTATPNPQKHQSHGDSRQRFLRQHQSLQRHRSLRLPLWQRYPKNSVFPMWQHIPGNLM